MSALLATSLVAMPAIAFADQAPEGGIQVDAAGQSLDAAGSFVSEEAVNGIPTVTIFVDESAQAIADAKANDPDNAYGTYSDLINSYDHSVRSVGSVGVTVPDGYVGEYGSASVPEGLVQLDFMRGRGNSTWNMGEDTPAKRAFKLKFQEKCDFFGMGASKEWALLANAFDETLVRNRMVSWLSSEMGMPYAPQMVPVDVVVVCTKDGEEVERKHLGSYCLSELVDVEEDRLAIDKLKKDTVADEDITGGYLLAIYDYTQNGDEPASNVFSLWKCNRDFFTKSPVFESEDLSEGQAKQRSYIRQYMETLDDLLEGGSPIDDAHHDEVADMMDLESAADYWWLQAFSNNQDAFRSSSTNLYKPRGGKLCWGPVWDFDLGFDYGIEGFGGSMPWINTLRDYDPRFVELLKERWNNPENGLNAKLDELTRAGGKLDAWRDEIEASWKENDGLYPDRRNPFHSADRTTFEDTFESFRTWIDGRRAWINEHLDEVGVKYVTVRYVVDGEEVKQERVDIRTCDFNWPEVTASGPREFVGWCKEGSDEVVENPRVQEDTVFVAKFKYEEGVPSGDETDYSSKVSFLSGAQLEIVGDGRIAYRASVTIPEVDGYDWSDSVMTFTVRPTGDAATAQAKTVKVPFAKATTSKGADGLAIATFVLPLSAIEMGQQVTSTFSYTNGGKDASVEMTDTLEGQVMSFVRGCQDEARVAYAKALHDFGYTSRVFFGTCGNGNVTEGKYNNMLERYTEAFDRDGAKAGIRSELEAIGAGKDIAGSQVKKVNMSLRFDSETTVEFNVCANEGVKDFSASATFKGKTFKGKKVSATQYRVRVTGVRAADLGELIELAGTADGAYSMRCSALSYAQAIMEKSACGDLGDDLMAALYNFHTAAQAIAE